MPRARLLLGWLGMVGCFAESNTPSQTDTSTSSDAETSTTNGDTSATTSTVATSDHESETRADTTDGGDCAEGERPVPPLPAEWQGPFVLFPGRNGGTPPECPDAFVPAAQDLVTAGPSASCRCDCALGCLLDVHSLPDCSDSSSGNIELTPDNCAPGGVFYVEHTGLSDPKECTDPDATLGEIAWADVMRVCGGDQQAMCLPVPPDAIGPCIRIAGEHACPEGLSRQIISAVDAEMMCDDCPSCIAAADSLCADLTVGIYSNSQCSFRSGDALAAGDCSGANAPNLELEGSLPPECEPTTSIVKSLVEPQTFCCAEP